MSFKLLKTTAAATVIGAASLNAQAASIWLEPVSQSINVGLGESATLTMWADASDVGGFLAGGLDLFYDSTLLTYNDDFAFDPAFPIDPSFSRTGDNCATNPAADGCSVPGEINAIAFGNFAGLAAAGPTLVGTLSFSGSPGLIGTDILTMFDNDLPAGNWFATDGSDLAGLVLYGEAAIDTVETVIPIPAAVWLFGSGLLGLVGIARRRKA